MRRFPAHLIVALGGLLMLVLGAMTIFAVDFIPPGQLLPTAMAMLTQMPPQAVATQLAQMGYVAPPSVQATAQSMWQQGIPADVIISTLIAAYNTGSTGGSGGSSVPPTALPSLQPPVGATPIPQGTSEGVVPLPTAMEIIPTAIEATAVLEVEPTIVPVEVGNISGSVLFSDKEEAGRIHLILTRPDGSALEIPVGAEGVFSFAGMEAGAYSLEATAQGHLSARAAFTLEAGTTFTLPPITLSAGDTNGDNVIDLLDAALIASNFGGPALVHEADLNHDGQIDVRDLTIVGKQFGEAGPLEWTSVSP